MRSTSARIAALSTVLFATAAGCEHKNKKSDPAPKTSGSGSAGSAAAAPGSAKNPLDSDMKPEPVAKADGEVRPPTAADLAEYTKDIAGEGALIANIETPMGTIHCELLEKDAPMTVANFVGLATGKKPWLNPKTNKVEKGVPFFDGIVFHRVIPDFMLQTGDPLGKGYGGPGYQFDTEPPAAGAKMDAGTLAMANAGPGTNGSQFFIMEGNRPDLVGLHTIFGKCKELDLVKQIARVPKVCPDCNPNDPRAAAPATPIAMTKVTITRGKI